ncbi:Bacteriophage coat protein B [Pseudomonas flavescens]|uniref:Bacteriophage coat protein B n=1 Tax=Phytopseudomonas flavescens TaxID=29435 RepID=A0A1G7ZNH0_9GAMM|nr:major capsid protein [Pseudomonas flavescens]SDH10199.1 Bacteriophage coat protein B [Pseudomonas flavescens]
MRNFKVLTRSLGAAAATGLLMAQQAYAALPAEAEAEMSSSKADAIALGGLVLVVLIAIAAFKYIRKAL